MKPIHPAPGVVDPVAGLAACHDRIRTFCAGLDRVVALPDLGDPRVPAAAAQAARYFGEGLPLHAADEDLSFGPRLRGTSSAIGPLLDALAADHVVIDRWIGGLLPLLNTLADGRLVDRGALEAQVEGLKCTLLPHIAREEVELFPACAALDPAELAAVAGEMAARRRA